MSPLVPSSAGKLKFSFSKTLWMWGNILPAAAFGMRAASVRTVMVSLGLAFITLCLGHSVGLHRGVIHRTYRTTNVWRGILVYAFILSGLGGPVTWARLHATRDYWQNRPDCPRYFGYRHSMLADFFWNLHLTFTPADKRCDAKLDPSVFSDRWLGFLERTWIFHALGFATVLFAVMGWEGLVVCACARVALSILGHWAIGFASHVWGDKPHPIAGASEEGTNNWWLGLISFGEGFHNSHHAFPESARLGLRWYQLDLGWLSLRAMAALGLVWRVQEYSPDTELLARIVDKPSVTAMRCVRVSGQMAGYVRASDL